MPVSKKIQNPADFADPTLSEGKRINVIYWFCFCQIHRTNFKQ